MLKNKPNQDTVDLLWMLLRTFETNLGKQTGPLDAELIRGGYRHFSYLTGNEQLPEWVKPLPPNPQRADSAAGDAS